MIRVRAYGEIATLQDGAVSSAEPAVARLLDSHLLLQGPLPYSPDGDDWERVRYLQRVVPGLQILTRHPKLEGRPGRIY